MGWLGWCVNVKVVMVVINVTVVVVIVNYAIVTVEVAMVNYVNVVVVV